MNPMAFRIHDSVVRGEIDNRVKGVVRGQIWIEGRADPVILELTGNAFWYVAPQSAGGTRLGTPGEIWVIPTPWVRIVPDRTQYVKAYQVAAPGMPAGVIQLNVRLPNNFSDFALANGLGIFIRVNHGLLSSVLATVAVK